MNIRDDKYEIKKILPSNVRVGDFLGENSVYFEIIDITYGFALYHITFKIPIPGLSGVTIDEIIAYEHTPIKIKRYSLNKILGQL